MGVIVCHLLIGTTHVQYLQISQECKSCERGLAYLSEATGPLRGARLLVANDPKARVSAAELEDAQALQL